MPPSSSAVSPDQPDEESWSIRFRRADVAAAEQIAALHADSWRRNYRGAYADSFLDGDLDADRLAVWSARLNAAGGTETVVAERDGRVVGFVHIVFDADERWGSLVDNLHVTHGLRRMGIGRRLLGRAARAVAERETGNAMYLWVLQQNIAAQRFYRAQGAVDAGTALVSPPGGDPERLHGTPRKVLLAWPDVTRALAIRTTS
jgi:ribosomal protein S18 acetylase RimI-like enzyme